MNWEMIVLPTVIIGTVAKLGVYHWSRSTMSSMRLFGVEKRLYFNQCTRFVLR